MAKAKKARPRPWEGPAREDNVDLMFVKGMEKAHEVLQRDDITIGAKSEELVVGMPFPALCLRYLFQYTVFPLGRVIQLAGTEGSCKTALMDEIFRWHMVYGGGATVRETENKDAAYLRNSILEFNPRFMSRMGVIPCDSLEQWQTSLTTDMSTFATMMDEKGGPGRTIPVAMGVDSLTAVDIQKEIDKTAKLGHASIGYALQALLITRFMRQAIVPNLRKYPFTVIGTNHLKQGIDPQTNLPVKNVPGGKAVNFMATFLVEMKRLKDIDLSTHGGIRLELLLGKNSVGVSRRKIQAEFLWWQAPKPEGGSQQRHAWDWHAASIELLVGLEDQDGKKELSKQIKAICDLRATRSTKTVWSRALGIPESEPVPYRQAGAMLEGRPDLLEPMYPLLGINPGFYFQPGMDYRQALTQAAEQGAKSTQPIYTNQDEVAESEVVEQVEESDVGDTA